MKLLHKEIKNSIKDAKNLNQILIITISILKNYKNSKANRIGYVAGAVTSDGDEKLKENIENLDRYTKQIRKENRFHIFSSTDIFDEKLIYNLEELVLSPNEVEKKFREFWRKILGSSYITDIFMTPGWQRSRGAKDEHKTAKDAGLKIHHLDN